MSKSTKGKQEPWGWDYEIPLIVRCVGCGERRPVDRSDGDVPMCRKCFSPMVVEKAETRDERNSR